MRRPAALLAALLVLSGGQAAAAAGPGPASNARPASVQGQAAINRVGERLPAVAREMGLDPGELRRQLRTDDTLWADRDGALYYVRPVDEVDHEHDTSEPAAASAPLSDTFTLHSLPGSDRTVFLDFDGHDASGTAWGDDVVAPAYDVDGDPSSFSSTELQRIQQVWALVAEDFAPFDVDVTTEEPPAGAIRRDSSSDLVYGTRAVITPGYIGCQSCGGVAYVGVFDVTGGAHDAYQPAWTFTNGVGNGAKAIAEATSHEVGHNLGLGHDGTSTRGYYAGHGDWAPIMGVGYGEPITQWLRGEYAGANNGQDDLAVMVGNGAPVRGDDHGATLSSATRLAGSTFAVDGVVQAPGDVDGFRLDLAAPSQVTLDVTVAALGPNLDAELVVRDASGAVVATDDPLSGPSTAIRAAGLDAGLALQLPAGSHLVTVDGVGKGNPSTLGYSDYGSLGAFTLSGTVTPTGDPEPEPNRAPDAVLVATPSSGAAPLVVGLDAATSTDPDGDALASTIDPGDGSPALTGPTASHTYTQPGTYVATVTVDDGRGGTSTATATVTVDQPAPSGAPPAHTGLTASGRTDVTLRWTDNSAGTASTEVFRETKRRGSTTRTLVATVPAGTDTYRYDPGSGRVTHVVVAVRDGERAPASDTATIRLR